MEAPQQLHVVFFPFMAQGHIIPTIDMAKLFSSRGVKTTIVTTPLHAPLVTEAIKKSPKHSLSSAAGGIHVSTVKFPSTEVGLPEGQESIDLFKTREEIFKFFRALYLLQQPFENLLQTQLSPFNCLVADMFFPWATDTAAKFNVPRLVFHGLSLFALCASENLRFYRPFKDVRSEHDPFVLPHFPHEIEFSKGQVPEFEIGETKSVFMDLLTDVKESEKRSFGIIINSFKELEEDYVEYFRKVWNRKAWLIGPLSLCNKETQDKAQRGKKSSIDEHDCLQWLNSRKPNSVVYACFGSVARLSTSQLREIALGLESSGQDFIWVVKKNHDDENKDDESWLSEGFEERNKNKGLIIRGWAPQVLILEHEATGAFITHCGWNSVLEAVCSGVTMVTWPTFAEQPFNEKLVTQVLRIGVPAGPPLMNRGVCEVKSHELAEAVRVVIGGEEGVEMRRRANKFKEMARKAVEEGGSSYNELSCLIDEIRDYPHHVKNT